MKRKQYLLLVAVTIVAGLFFLFTKAGADFLAFSPDGKYLVSGSGWWDDDYAVRLWDVDAGFAVQSFYGHTKNVTSVAFSPDGKYIMSGSLDHTVKKWDVSNGQLVSSIAGIARIVVMIHHKEN